jgi:predicted TIM-barrel fold metal-dependent hydrolase
LFRHSEFEIRYRLVEAKDAMPTLVEIKPVDREFYESRVRDFVPQGVIDVHAHIWTAEQAKSGEVSRRGLVTWPSRVAASNPIEDLLETYRLMLPGKLVTPMVFSSPTLSADTDALNAYVSAAAARCGTPALLLARPEWSAAELEDKILSGGFLGVKVYLSFAPAHIPPDEIRIFDFLPPHQLERLDRRGWLVMLHIPRPGRLGDPANLADLVEIERRFGNAQVIVAHVGRAYCIEDVGNAFEALAGTKRMCFDISANTNAEVFRRLIDAVGPKRILFGTDMPILRMRMRRICENGRYVNLVPRGLYGDVSGDPHLREVDEPEARRLTFFLYEEIDAFRRAAESRGLRGSDIQDVFHDNAGRLIDRAREGRR